MRNRFRDWLPGDKEASNGPACLAEEGSSQAYFNRKGIAGESSMTRGMKIMIMWAVIILVLAYLLNVNVATLLTDIIHAAQNIHNSHH